MKAVTLAPAAIFGVDDRLGTIEAGKRANLVIAAGHLLQPTTEVKHLFVAGRPVPPESRQTELYHRYRHRLQEVRSGLSPLGLDRPPAQVAGSDADAEADAESSEE